jgi:hypothetical protein
MPASIPDPESGSDARIRTEFAIGADTHYKPNRLNFVGSALAVELARFDGFR